jgi:dTDP-4-dehydrorhamnose reductase
MMRVAITGGRGFLGRDLAESGFKSDIRRTKLKGIEHDHENQSPLTSNQTIRLR